MKQNGAVVQNSWECFKFSFILKGCSFYESKVLLLLLVVLTITHLGCGKDEKSDQLLYNHWEYVNRIISYTTTNPSTLVKTIVFDTLVASSVENRYLEFNQDVLNGKVQIGNHIKVWKDQPYTKQAKDLIFYGNPFTTDNLPNTELRKTRIDYLSDKKLIFLMPTH